MSKTYTTFGAQYGYQIIHILMNNNICTEHSTFPSHSKHTLFYPGLIICVFLVSNLFFPETIDGQQVVPSTRGSVKDPFGDFMNLGTKITEIPYQSSIKGSGYLYENWVMADVMMAGQKEIFRDLMVKIDVQHNLLERQYNDEIKLLNASQTISFTVKSDKDTFLTRNALDPNYPNGFFKVLYNGEVRLLIHYLTDIKKANYNVALDVGNKDDEIIIVNQYYVILEGDLLPVETTRKKLIRQFDSNNQVGDYIRDKKINPKNEEDLINLVQYINTI